MFEEFINKEVKCCYKDFNQYKIARGKLEKVEEHLVKITGRLGTIIINKKNIEKMGLLNTDKEIQKFATNSVKEALEELNKEQDEIIYSLKEPPKIK